MIKKIWIKDFRNFTDLHLSLDDRVAVLLQGQNNQGKSNFLEALYCLFTGSSCQLVDDDVMISLNKDEAVLGADFGDDDNDFRLYLKLSKETKKQAFLNNEKQATYKRIKQEKPVEFVSAENIRIFSESPQLRRRELDRVASLFYPEYTVLLKKYEQNLRQKNRALKNQASKNELSVWNQQLISLAPRIVELRKNVLEEICEDSTRFLTDLDLPWGTQVEGKLILQKINIDPFSAESYKTYLQQHWDSVFEKERILGYSLFGPQRDDFQLLLKGKSLFEYYSKGVNRTIAFLFKLAQWKKIESLSGKPLTLLLDEPFAELDSEVKSRLVTLLNGYKQIFYTTVLKEDENLFKDRVFGQVLDGHVQWIS